jgi:hypothetical protein
VSPTEDDLAIAARVSRAMLRFARGLDLPSRAFTLDELDRAERTLAWIDAHAVEVDAATDAEAEVA